MRRLKLIFAMLLIYSQSYGKIKSIPDYGSTIGISMSSGIVRKQAELTFGHAFSSNWSVSGRVSIALSQFIKDVDEDEKEHYGEFKELSPVEEISGSDRLFIGNASILYWPVQCHKGAYICLGCNFQDGEDTDIETGCGFYFKVWKILYADISYTISLISSYHNERMNGNGLNICFHLKF